MFAKIVFGQLRHKWPINLLLFLTITALVSLYVFILNTNSFTTRSMQLIMKNMGLNQMIMPASGFIFFTIMVGRQTPEKM